MYDWNTLSFPFGAFRPIFRVKKLVSGSVASVQKFRLPTRQNARLCRRSRWTPCLSLPHGPTAPEQW